VCADRGIRSPLADGAAPPEGVEVTVRVSPGGETLLYLLNHGPRSTEVHLEPGTYTDLLTGEACGEVVALEERGVRLLTNTGKTR
jgi:beta-galactosidase